MHQHYRFTLTGLLFVLPLNVVFPESLFAAPANNAGQQQDFPTRVDNAIATGRLELIPLMMTGGKHAIPPYPHYRSFS